MNEFEQYFLPLSILLIPLLFLAYFIFFRPWQLKWGATAIEIKRPMPGDEIIAKPTFNATRAATINAIAENIYPWIIQMGVTRAGWYSYDLLDTLLIIFGLAIVSALYNLTLPKKAKTVEHLCGGTK